MVSVSEESMDICTLESWFRIPVVVVTSDEGSLRISFNGSLHSNVVLHTVNCLKHTKQIGRGRFRSL